jgi:hypothetical protein
MIRRTFLQTAAAAVGTPVLLDAAGQPPIPEPHFPNRLYQFVWRNWELANTERIAEVAGARPADILELGRQLGLPAKPTLTADQLRRIHITVIRQNWHLLPNAQIVRLLGWTPEKFAFILKEDDFLDVKLGAKPDCTPVAWAPPDAEARRRAGEIRQTLEKFLGRQLHAPGEPAFRFIELLSDMRPRPARDAAVQAGAGQVDLSGASVRAENGADAAAASRLSEYLRVAMGSNPAGAKAIALRIEPGDAAVFRVAVNDTGAAVKAGSPRALLQAIYWMQDAMEEAGGPFLPRGETERRAVFQPRYLYPYFALYGDPLLETEVDPFPDGYLEKLARAGIDGVWMQCVLSNMARSKAFPEFGQRADERLANLRKITARLARFGMRVFFYLNEPRSMPAEFFRGREGLRGASGRGVYAMCTSTPEVRGWIADTLAHIFAEAPEAGGVFSITASENFTNCHSHGRAETCPRCSKRQAGEVIAEVVGTFREGVRRSSRTAEVTSWDWGWTEEVTRVAIPRLPRDVNYMCVSEWSIPIERGGVKSQVGEYSLSVVGPGPRAKSHWAMAKEAGLRTFAKTQFNNSWEISVTPYIPVPYLVARHCQGLRTAGVSGIQASWTLGGFPSPNLAVAKEFYFTPVQDSESILRRVATRRYGKAAAPLALEAWKAFSDAFEQLPYGTVPGYVVPTQHGPANLLRTKPTGVRASMILFPQDDWKRWIGPYPPAVARDLFARMADAWEKGLAPMRKVAETAPASRRELAAEDLAIAETCHIHFRSTADQMDFYMLRDGVETDRKIERMRAIAARQRDFAIRLYGLARRHSLLAYEASNHYYYRPLDLAEAIVSAQYLLDHDLKENPNA